MQETNLSSGLAATECAITDATPFDALQAELAKWQARVPKLAGALRERTSEVAALKAELANRADAAAAGSAPAGFGIEARDTLIEELEGKVRALGGKYQDAEGQLHARDLEISQLRQEAGEWREKWQSATSSLDEQADAADQKDRTLKGLQGELDELLNLQETQNGRIKEQDLELTTLRERGRSLESRNENLFETTELANRQIETLGENLEHLRAELKSRKQEIESRDADASSSAKAIEDLKSQLASRDQDIEFLHEHVEEKQGEIVALGERIAALEPLQEASAEATQVREQLQRLVEERDHEIASLNDRLCEFDTLSVSFAESEQRFQAVVAELSESRQETASREADLKRRDEERDAKNQEIRHLEDCVARAEETTIRFEVERRQLSGQLDELKKRNQHLEAQLSERSDLVVGLEQEKTAITSKKSTLESENKRLSEALEKAQQAAAGNADHLAQVDSRMDRQKQLMENLEKELAEVQEEYAAASKRHQRELSEKAAELAALRERADEDSVESLKAQMTELEGVLEATLAEVDTAQTSAQTHQRQAEELSRELDTQRSQVDSARSQLAEKVEKLEKQLRKQSKETSAAEEAAAVAKVALEEQQAVVSRVPDEVSGENAQLQSEVIKLEGMVRERTEQLNKLRWQQDMIEKQNPGESSESKMLVVLNQQLTSARDDNQRLREKVRELEARPEPAVIPDDLSTIRGIGPKLVKQLRKLGITQFDQIATLSEADLDDVGHPLHGMKGRIVKDSWIEQAAKLGSLS